MSRAVRNALVFAALVGLAWVLLVLAWRFARWLFIIAVWIVAITVAGVISLVHVVTQRLPPWIARFRADHVGRRQGPKELAP